MGVKVHRLLMIVLSDQFWYVTENAQIKLYVTPKTEGDFYVYIKIMDRTSIYKEEASFVFCNDKLHTYFGPEKDTFISLLAIVATAEIWPFFVTERRLCTLSTFYTLNTPTEVGCKQNLMASSVITKTYVPWSRASDNVYINIGSPLN